MLLSEVYLLWRLSIARATPLGHGGSADMRDNLSQILKCLTLTDSSWEELEGWQEKQGLE